MILRNLSASTAFVTKDGSEIRSILDLSNAPVRQQSLAEASLEPGRSTMRHRHPHSEEFYFVTQGEGLMELDGETKAVGVGDAILIPAGLAHQILNTGKQSLKILCCCAPPYRHEDTEFVPLERASA
jgi:mannose-6-phosphate isomerase-like protein (cupin superfamily)